MSIIDISKTDAPVALFEKSGHANYWLGNTESTAFRTNTYLIRDGERAWIVDPGNRALFEQVREWVTKIMPPQEITGLIVCHQDPDVAASMVDWLELNPDLKVYTSPRTQVLLPYYGRSDYDYVNVEEHPLLELTGGGVLRFVPAPFLHFAGAFATYDAVSKSLFTGDVFASLEAGNALWAESFDELAGGMELFHAEYMGSNIATRGFVGRLSGLEISSLLPQHGSLIGGDLVAHALRWLNTLQCGTDLIYPHLGYDR
ncbi:MAG: MBL fold metallo-hydrolase [Zetaproteobacteria bacterium CG_4_9_14_3_um_filter_53_7]|nr:MAG: MBL fold metallo-hydrolase [Zetaproteobacteria bacterium CG_4_9_14_3_um_filter_53_7]